MDENTIICRCSDITLKEIKELINKGYTTLDEIKRISRAGMGPCQGRTCGQLIMREIAKITGQDVSQMQYYTSRPPVKGIKIEAITTGGEFND